jgi:hypothetical protein
MEIVSREPRSVGISLRQTAFLTGIDEKNVAAPRLVTIPGSTAIPMLTGLLPK